MKYNELTIYQRFAREPTGVFIPIEEWRALEKKYHFKDNEEFELSDQQKNILDERLKSDKKDFIPARKL